MAGAHARTVPSSSVLRSGNALLGNEGGNGFAQPTLSSLAARRSQFGGANMLAGYTNNPLINGVTNAGLAGIAPSLGGTGNPGSGVGGTTLITGSSGDFSGVQRNTGGASEGLALSGLVGMGLPASPVSMSSAMANQQVSSGLSRLEQQDVLLQQQVRSATPPLSATSPLAQLAQQAQGLHAERGPQGSQQLGGGQQSSGFASQTAGSGSHGMGGGGSHQSLVLGGGAQQANGVGYGSNVQHGKAIGASALQGLVSAKEEPQSVGHPMKVQAAQLLTPKMEMKAETELDQKVVQQAMQQSRSGSNVGVTAEMQLQEALQRQQSKQLQAQLSAMQQQRLLQGVPQQHLHDVTSLQAQQQQHLQQLQHQQQLQLLQQQANALQSADARKHPEMEAGACARRLMQYLYHQRHRPPDNNIAFWRNFVEKYFARSAKKRWCVTQYGSGGRQPTGVFPQDMWHCEICGTNPGRGFETSVEVLPRLFKIKFDSGIQEELLFVDMPHECRLASGQTVLEYGKAIQESVFEQLRVVREGQLRIVFSAELKILSWEFCARSHEELLPRRLIIPQVNQLVQISQKHQNSQSGGAGASGQDLQTNCHMFVASARQLAKNLEMPNVNELGYTKRYVRCLQISEVVNSMKDLIDYSRDNSFGPIASLHKFPRRSDGSSRSMLRNAQLRLLQEQQQRQEQVQQRQQELQQQQQLRQTDQQQQQQQQQRQAASQQQEDLDLQSLLAETNTTALSSLQQQFEEANQLESRAGDGLEEVISAPAETDSLSAFFPSNPLAALQTSLHDTLQSAANGGSVQNMVQSPLGSSSLHAQQQQQQVSGGRGGAGAVTLQASPTNSLSSFQNSFPSLSGGGASSYSRGEASSQQKVGGGGGGGALLQQQKAQGSHHGGPSNVVHNLLQEMMLNQQLSNNGNSMNQQGGGHVGVGGGVGSLGNGLNGNLTGSLAGSLGLNGLGQGRMLGLGGGMNSVHSIGGLVNNNHVGVTHSSSSIDSLMGNSASSVGIGGVGSNVAFLLWGTTTCEGWAAL
ncbi:uncharacterized protein [Physcomitrium patens]|uniref:uncharacterized protein n=1 Tax=Physcomitrium patens TaxID=3218 RepID=UPI003CCDD83B